MGYSIIDKLCATGELKRAILESRERYTSELKRQYKYGRLTVMNVTREEAIKINLGNLKTINKVYFDNIDVIERYARCYQYRMSTGTRIYRAEDIINQVYVDIRYYDFTDDSTLKHCLNCTCKTSNNGGIMNYNAYRSERKTSRFLYDEIKTHNAKMEDGATLIDYVGADELKSNPEAILIDQETPKKYTRAMQRDLIARLKRSEINGFLEAFGIYE